MSMFKAPHVILTKVAPETAESSLGPGFQFWQLPPRGSEDVLVSEQTEARLAQECLHNNVQPAQRSMLGLLQSRVYHAWFLLSLQT